MGAQATNNPRRDPLPGSSSVLQVPLPQTWTQAQAGGWGGAAGLHSLGSTHLVGVLLRLLGLQDFLEHARGLPPALRTGPSPQRGTLSRPGDHGPGLVTSQAQGRLWAWVTVCSVESGPAGVTASPSVQRLRSARKGKQASSGSGRSPVNLTTMPRGSPGAGHQ